MAAACRRLLVHLRVMWIDVKSTWDLTATDAEVTALDEMLQTCATAATAPGTLRDGPYLPG